MANLMFNVTPDFNMHEMVAKLTQMYQAKGFLVSTMPVGNGVTMDFSKDDSGIKKIAGLALGVKANISVNSGTLTVSYTEAEWTGKIIAGVVGLFLCWVVCITAIVGCVNQSSLETRISNDIRLLVGNNVPPQPFAPQQPYPPQQSPPPVQPVAQPQPQFLCQQCGANLPAGAVFCPGCGNKNN